jgi:hypothetical protein
MGGCMKRNSVIRVIALFAVMAMYFGCGQKTADKIGYGTLENGIYRNEYFGMRVTMPKDWFALDDESRKALMQKGKKMIAGQDKNLEAALDASELNNVNLLVVYKYPPGTPVPYNPSLACVAEKVGHLPGIKTGSDYLYHVKKLMERSQLKYDFAENIYSEKIGGVSFDVQDTEVNVGAFRIQQKYYAAIMKGYALGIVLSSTTKEEQEALKQILTAIDFGKQ